MPRDPPVVFLYPLSNYKQGQKGSLLEKDSSVRERMQRMEVLYKKLGMRRVVEGLLIAHEHSHPFLLLLQIGNTYFKLFSIHLSPFCVPLPAPLSVPPLSNPCTVYVSLVSPGGRLRPAEHETDGLRRKLENKLGCPNKEHSINWQVGELVSTWWRPNFETVMYPYVPPQVAAPKESRKIFLTQLPPTGILGVPKNLKLLAVPLFELYDNAHRYGPVIASLPQLLARVKFIYCDHNAQPLSGPHIDALQLTNIETYDTVQKRKKTAKDPNAMKVDTDGSTTATGIGSNVNSNANVNVHSNRNQNQNQNVNHSNNPNDINRSMESAVDKSSGPKTHDPRLQPPPQQQQQQQQAMQSQQQQQRIVIPNVAPPQSIGGGPNGPRPNVQISPMVNQFQRNPSVIGNLYAQNLLLAASQAQQQRMQVQQLLAASQAQQAQHILRPRPFANARVIITPSPVNPQSMPRNNPPGMQGQMGQTHSALNHRPHPPQMGPAMPLPNSHPMHRRGNNQHQ